ncbi:MAG: 50S ribosomal protein L19e [Candidatus Aenigmarchaeota archaeon]|nr:50S ribosomal protein L19e [Candidatus Aenigmarchaeota archaeon]
MDTSYQKRLAAKILKISPRRVKMSQNKDIEESLTRSDVRHLIVKGLITKKQKKGTTRVEAREKLVQKKKGRSSGRGRGKGTKYSKVTQKELWMKTVRAQRKLLKELRDNGQITTETYGLLYRRSKGGDFRNKNHMLSYLKENSLMTGTKKGGANA